MLRAIRDLISGEVLLARSLLSSCQADLAKLLREVASALPVPIAGVVSDGQTSIRKAAAEALEGVPHQLRHFHYLREAATPVYEADRHAKVQLKKKVRGVRPISMAATIPRPTRSGVTARRSARPSPTTVARRWRRRG